MQINERFHFKGIAFQNKQIQTFNGNFALPLGSVAFIYLLYCVIFTSSTFRLDWDAELFMYLIQGIFFYFSIVLCFSWAEPNTLN